MAGATAAVNYIASVGRRFGDVDGGASRRAEIVAGMAAIRSYEMELAERLASGLQMIPRTRIYGITDPARFDERLPVVSFTLEGHAPKDVAKTLGDDAIFSYCGDFYAITVVERLGLAEVGGLIRIGINHYNTAEEVDRLLAVLGRIVG
jgi:selenocysteine lyase/cysteine desulfurase